MYGYHLNRIQAQQAGKKKVGAIGISAWELREHEK